MDQRDTPTTPGTFSIFTDTLSRRTVGKLVGATALAVAATPTPAVAVAPSKGSDPITRGEFVALISDHFDWVHSSEYLDPYKLPQPTFTDVRLGRTPYAKQIETAAEESVLDGAGGAFGPRREVTPQDAALWLARAFIRPSSGPGTPVLTAAELAAMPADQLGAIARLRDGDGDGRADGHGRSDSAHGRPSRDTLSWGTARSVLSELTGTVVSPPQVMCKPGTTAPRRYITISTPTVGATIRYAYTVDGSEPPTPTSTSPTFDLRENGVLQFVNPLGSGVDSRFVRLKTVATKDGLTSSPVREFSWTILRPEVGKFQAELIRKPTRTSPAVWKINNPAEYYQANVYYIEGSRRGVVFDAGEYSYLKANLKTFIDSIATKPYDLVLGHSHPDHGEQVYNFTSAGIALYLTAIERAALIASNRADFKAAGQASVAVPDGHQLNLGNVQVSLFHAPGHMNGLMTLLVNQTGWVYASDHFGCNRPYTADTTQYNVMKADLFLSLQHQLLADYESRCGTITEVTNAHQVQAVGMQAVDNFVACFQQLIDQGDAVTEPSIRGGVSGNPTGPVRNSRMTMVGDMWRDRNWMAIGNSLGSGLDRPADYLSAPTTAYPCGATIDYNTPDGYRRYSQLANVQFGGGTLVGVDVHWAPPANGLPNMIANKFDPWTYEYTVKLSRGTRRLRIWPTALSSHVSSLRVNGESVAAGRAHAVNVRPGSVVTIDVVAPDRTTTSQYRFTMA